MKFIFNFSFTHDFNPSQKVYRKKKMLWMDQTVLSFHISRFMVHFIKLINKKFRNIFDGRVSIKIDLTFHELMYFSNVGTK